MLMNIDGKGETENDHETNTTVLVVAVKSGC